MKKNKNTNTMEIFDVFKQFVVKTKLNEDLKKLIKFSFKIEKEQKGRFISNRGGFQSNDLDLKELILDSLIKKIQLNSNVLFNDFLKIKHQLSLGNIWININRHKDFNIPHVHPFSKLSGVFYVKIPNNSGELTFINDYPIEYFINLPSSTEFNGYNSSEWKFKPEENMLYLFPSWLKHYVHPNLSDQERISISFNLV
jgi:uncharacterized protein (TIGR02466 family)